MQIDHIAVWTDKLEELKDFYVKYFGGTAGSKYKNEKTQFESYFLTFGQGARMELMRKPFIPGNINDEEVWQHIGIIHIAFHAESKEEVEIKARELEKDGYKILSGPRTTGDGYYEFETLDPDGNRIEVTCHYA
jgi:lactoylglutathione lyase